MAATRSARPCPARWAANAAWVSRSERNICQIRLSEGACGARRLVEKDGERRDIGVPFDEGRPRAEPLQNLVEQGPHPVADATAMVIDQDRRTVIEHIPGMASQMILGDRLAGQFVQPVGGVLSEIV